VSASDRGCDSLAALLDDAAVELERVATGSQPDFADMVARAQRLEPTRARPELVAEARRLDTLRGDQLEHVGRIGDLEALLASAKVELSLIGEACERGGVPPLRAGVPVRSGGARDHVHVRFWAIALGLAAVLALALSLGWGLRARTMDPAAPREYSGANKIAGGDEWSSARIDDTPAPSVLPRSRVPAPAPLEVVIVKEAPVPVLPSTPRKPSVSTTDRLIALDRDARTAWKRGDLQAAEAGLAAIVQRGGRRSLVDLAYGDLFEIARQRRDRAREAQLWQQYLRRFPDGRFADEARAGLCRRATGAQASACWQRYLDERPHGTYRDHARAALRSGASAGPR